MKITLASAAIVGLGLGPSHENGGSHAFSPPTILPTTSGWTSSSLRASLDAVDPYARVMENLNNAMAADASTTANVANMAKKAVASAASAPISSSPMLDNLKIDQKSLIDAISSVADAANDAARSSAQISTSLGSSMGNNFNGIRADFVSTPISTPEILSTAQAKLSLLSESTSSYSTSPADSSKALMASLLDALDASIQAADQAAASTSSLADNLVQFNAALSNSMSAAAPHFPPMDQWSSVFSPDVMEAAQKKMDGLAHSLSGNWQEWSDGLSAGLSSVLGGSLHGVVQDETVQSLLAELDRKMDMLPQGSAAPVVLYAVLAIMVGQSQNSDLGKFGKGNKVSTSTEPKPVPAVAATNQNLEDQVLAMVNRLLDESGATRVEKKLQPVTAMASCAQPAMAAAETTKEQAKPALVTATANQSPSTIATVVPSPPKEDPALNLVAAAAVENNINPSPPRPEDSVVIEFCTQKQPKLNVVTKKQPPKKKVVKPKAPPASPLARLLADELGLDLVYIGKGSGKNGKILIDDVRTFQARLEQAKQSISGSGSYFASVNA